MHKNKQCFGMVFVSLSVILSLSFSLACRAGGNAQALVPWKAGAVVSVAEVRKHGVDKCFGYEQIPDTVFKRMLGKSFKTYCTVDRADLRYVKVLHYNQKGQVCVGELVCDKSVAADLVDIFRKLYEAKYPIERMTLIDDYDADDVRSMNANNTSCFNFRFVAGSRVLSNHSRGRAIDVNPLYNPYVARRKDGSIVVSPQKGKRYADRSKKFRFKIDKDDLCYRLFKEHGFVWGGSWKTKKDYQHFEK